MTEAEWSTCTDPVAMLPHVTNLVTARKLGLFMGIFMLPGWAGPGAGEVTPQDPYDILIRRRLRGREAMAGAVHTLAPMALRVLESLFLSHPSTTLAPSTLADTLREFFGPLPFRSLAVDPAWRAWNDGCVAKIAQGIFDDGRFADLPILADALLDAGCDSDDLLDHLRRPGGHVRGCWALDLVLGLS